MTDKGDNAYDAVSADTIAWMFFVDSLASKLVTFVSDLKAMKPSAHISKFNSTSSTEAALSQMGLRMSDEPQPEEERYSVCPGCQGQKPEAKRVCDDCVEGGL